MYVDPENYGDADKYFRKCFIKVKEYGDTLVLIDKVTSEALWATDEKGEAVCIEINGEQTGVIGYDIDYVIPKKSYFQSGKYACFLNRIPARMWKKGVSSENTQFFQLHPNGFVNWTVCFDSLKAYVNKPTYLPYTEAVNNPSVALSPRFAMTGDKVFLDQSQVAKYYPSSNTLLCKKLFMRDLAPLFPGVKIAKG